MVKLKFLYPELAGVLMYGGGAKAGFANATNSSTHETEMANIKMIRSANLLMQEFWPGEPAYSYPYGRPDRSERDEA